MSFGNFYSEIYDSIHHDKHYDLEAEQIASFLKQKSSLSARVLDFGCGTGKHARLLSDFGLDIFGYDPNVNMIHVARSNNVGIPFYDNLGGVPEKFDFVYSLFDVLSYQISDSAVKNFLGEVNSLVKPEGWVLLDGWHLPGVLNDPPQSRTKFFSYDGNDYIRDVTVLEMNSSGVTSLDIGIRKYGSAIIEHREHHKLRGFYKEQLFEFITLAGGKNIDIYNGYDYSKSLDDSDWRFAISYQL